MLCYTKGLMPHIHEKIDFAVSILIVNDDKVLLVNHPRYDLWLPIGGHIELDEDSDQALFREAKEESGLDIEVMSHKPSQKDKTIKPLYAPHYVDIHEANPPHKHLGLIYFAKSRSNKFIKSDEHTDMKWFSTAELADPKYKISETVQFYASEAIQLAKTFKSTSHASA